MKKQGIILIFLGLFIAQGLGAIENEVGEIITISGACSIDAFGTGEFIKPQKGDKLYKTTHLKTSEMAHMEVTIFKDKIIIPENSHFILTSYIQINQKNQNEDWFMPFWDIIQRASESIFHDEEHVDLVSRGRQYLDKNRALFSWNTGDGVSKYLEEVRLLTYLIGSQGRLDKQSGEVLFEDNRIEVYYLLGMVHLKNRNIHSAVQNLEKSLALINEQKKKIKQKPSIQTALALAYYFKNNRDKSRKILETINRDLLPRDLRIIGNWLLEEFSLNKGEPVPQEVLKALKKDLKEDRKLEKAHSLFLKAMKK